MLAVISGAVLALATIALVRPLGPWRERRAWAVLLVVAAAIYVGFALFGNGVPLRWIDVELAGVALYLVPALLGLRYSPHFLAAGWLLHVAWDVGLHLGSPFVPGWSPLACVGYDVAVAVYVATQARRWRE